MTALTVRPAIAADADPIWGILRPIIRAGETYALPREWPRHEALAYWFAPGHRVFVAEAENAVLGTGYLQANQRGGGDHVANAAFATGLQATGRGVARAMALHVFDAARAAGFTAMQFNFVVASNTRAVALWRALGFAEVGRLPGAFRHHSLGLVDALVMHRAL